MLSVVSFNLQDLQDDSAIKLEQLWNLKSLIKNLHKAAHILGRTMTVSTMAFNIKHICDAWY
jgi:hypothetical protein